MGEQMVGDDLAFRTQGIDGTREIRCVPEGDCGEHDVEAAGTVLLRLSAAIL